MTRREFNTSLAGLAGSTIAQPAARRQPNIVFICSDQHSGRVLAAAGHPLIRTPNLDRLARMGVVFRNTYSGNPVCVPGRASMMSGRYASDVNSFCNSTVMGKVPSWGNYLRDSGYNCWASGKLDLTKGADYGFTEVRTSHGHSGSPDITSLFRSPVAYRVNERGNVNGRWEDREIDSDGELARRGIEFIRSQKGSAKPWAAYMGMHMPHPKFVAQKKYLEVYPPDKMPLPEIPEGYLERRHTMFQILANFKGLQVPIAHDRVRRARAAYFGMISELDGYVGWVLDEIEKAGQMDNTLFIYTSDHGEMLGEHGLWLKNVLLENAARVPLIMAGPGLPKGRIVDTPVSHVDMVATILDIAGAAPRNANLRGRSLANGAAAHPGFAFSESHSEGNCTGSFMIRKGDWKYIYFTGDDPLLFNLKDDPGEFHNLAGKAQDVRKELHGILTSQLDPDAVTERAFAEQERVLDNMVRTMKPDEFYEEIVGRLGPAQARILTNRHYRKRTG
ncbi:MAG: sulfatase-like hydrolase/transferase [Bryobacteraceae bacterium]